MSGDSQNTLSSLATCCTWSIFGCWMLFLMLDPKILPYSLVAPVEAGLFCPALLLSNCCNWDCIYCPSICSTAAFFGNQLHLPIFAPRIAQCYWAAEDWTGFLTT